MKEGEITPEKGAEEYISRRKRLLELLPENSVAILAAAPDINWKGPVAGVEAALETFKAEKAYPMRKIHKVSWILW
ncbi:hypothetical protein Q3G72_031834 [Acer saccharum]|nr:hypothetical protein Q3G72_031834 [Acer saccharum]